MHSASSSELLAHAPQQRKVVRVLIADQILGGIGMGAALVAVPLTRLAQARGRRFSLATGALIAGSGALLAITAVAVNPFPLLLLALALLGVGSATNLQVRFTATDLASSKFRARDLSIVVWSTTIGAVLGPNLFGLRPDPLLTALAARYAVTVIAFSLATMVALMSMTPIHLLEHGATLIVIGLTISLHVAGMYGLSPVFGWLADRLILVGLGWSASLVAGSALIAEAVSVTDRAALQGFSDLSMNAVGALGGASAGLVLSAVGYSRLGLDATLLVAAIVVWTIARTTAARRSEA